MAEVVANTPAAMWRADVRMDDPLSSTLFDMNNGDDLIDGLTESAYGEDGDKD